jgi:hypothetical protein
MNLQQDAFVPNHHKCTGHFAADKIERESTSNIAEILDGWNVVPTKCFDVAGKHGLYFWGE